MPADVIPLHGSVPSPPSESCPFQAVAAEAVALGATMGVLLIETKDGLVLRLPVRCQRAGVRGLLEEARDDMLMEFAE